MLYKLVKMHTATSNCTGMKRSYTSPRLCALSSYLRLLQAPNSYTHSTTLQMGGFSPSPYRSDDIPVRPPE